MNDADSGRLPRTCARENCGELLPPRARRWCSRACGRLAAAERRRAAADEARQRHIADTKTKLVTATERHYYGRLACAEAGVSARTARRWEADDAELAAALDASRDIALDALAAEVLTAARAGAPIERVRVLDLANRTAERVEARRGPGRARRERIAAAMSAADDADAMTEAQLAAVGLDDDAAERVRAAARRDRAAAVEAARSGSEPAGPPEAGSQMVLELTRRGHLAAVP